MSVEEPRSFYKLVQKLQKGKVISTSQRKCEDGVLVDVKTIEFRYRTPSEFIDRVVPDLIALGAGEQDIQSVLDDFFNCLAEEIGFKSPVPTR